MTPFLARHIPTRSSPTSPTRPIQEAKAKPAGVQTAFDLDWSLVTGATNVTLSGTMFVNGFTYLYGTTHLSASTVLKHTNSGYSALLVEGPLVADTAPYRIAVSTAESDDSIGEKLPWSSGVVTNGSGYGNPALQIDYYVSNTVAVVHDLRVSFAREGLSFYGGPANSGTNLAFVGCNTAISPYFSDNKLMNMLIYNCDNAFNGSSSATATCRVEHLTCDIAKQALGTNATLLLTNSLLVNCTNSLYSGTNNAATNTASAIFSVVGAGAHYLPATSPYLGQGNTNVAVLNMLRSQRSTQAPTVLSNTIISWNTNLVPVVPRSYGNPDLGWHGPAVDFAVNNLIITNATLTVNQGTVLATFATNGIHLLDGGNIVCNGSPTNYCRLTRFYNVQEISTNWGGNGILLYAYSVIPYHSSSTPSSTGYFRFTAFDGMSGCGYHIYNLASYTFVSLKVQDCTANVGTFEMSPWTTPPGSIVFQNNLFEGVTANLYGDFDVTLYNNLFKGGSVYFDNEGHTWIVRDTSFHDCSIDDQGHTMIHDHNAYVNTVSGIRLYPTNASDIVLSSFTYTNGPLGSYYQLSTNLVDAGSRYASNAMLFHYTANASGLAETNTMCDIGYHAPAAGTNGLPLDSDGDGVPNWQENISGTGIQQVGETDWQTPDSDFLPHSEPLGPCSRRTPLVISEIMYHPTNSENYEFIEIYNTHHLPQDLSGFQITEAGILSFTFPTNSLLSPGTFLIVVPDMSQFAGLTNKYGPYSRHLPNNGPGHVQLLNRVGAVLLDVTYDCDPPWPASADGVRHSLVLSRPSYGEGDARAWSASSGFGGSPGLAETNNLDFLRAIKINELLANPTNGQPQFIELYNHCNFPIDISGCFLAKSKTTLTQLEIPSATIMPPRGFLTFNPAGYFNLTASGDQVFFTSADQTHIVDSVSFKAQAPGISMGRSPDGAANFHELLSRTPGVTNSGLYIRDIVINELMYHPLNGSNAEEYIEIYNKGVSTQNLNGWRFADAITFTFPNIAIAPSNSFVLANNASNLANLHTNLVNGGNLFGNYSGSLKNSGDKVTLMDASGVIIDQVTYSDGGRWGHWSDGGGSSLELIDPRSDNRLAASWADSDETAKSITTNLFQQGTIELGDGVSPINALEISLLNEGECALNNANVTSVTNRIVNWNFHSGASGWALEGNHETSSWSTNGTNGGYLWMRASGRGDYLANRIEYDWGSELTPGASAFITANARWLRGSAEILFRIRGNWLEATTTLPIPKNLGTPGLVNSQAKANTGPAIFDVSHFPVVPAAGHLVVVSARVNDPDGISTVVLYYRMDPATNVTSVAMLDDGTSGDTVAGDGVYSATIPSQASGQLVAFYVQAADQFTPHATNSFPNDAPSRECLVRFGEAPTAGSFGTYRIWMTQTNQSIWTSRAQIHAGLLDATFVYGDQRVIYNIGAAYNGSDNTSHLYTGPTNALCGYTLNFPSDDRLLGATDALLDWSIGDPTGQREQVAYWMTGQLGLPYNYRRFVHLFVNGRTENSRPNAGTFSCAHIYEDAQQPNSDFLSQWYPNNDSGELYKLQIWRYGYRWTNGTGVIPSESGTNATLLNITNSAGAKNLASYRWNWRKRAVQDGANNYTNLYSLVDAVQTPADGNYIPAVRGMLDAEEWARIFALERSVGNFDCYGNTNGQNMYAYRGATATNWQLLLYDTELIMGVSSDATTTSVFNVISDPRMADLLSTNEFQRAYWRGFQGAVNGPLQSSNYTPVISGNFNALVSNGVLKDSNHVMVALSGNDITTLTNWLEGRRNYLSNELWKITAPFAITNGTTSTPTNINLAGTAPVEIKFLRLDSRSTNEAITWLTLSNWSVPLVLSNGANTITVKGLDRFTNSIATNTITITH